MVRSEPSPDEAVLVGVRRRRCPRRQAELEEDVLQVAGDGVRADRRGSRRSRGSCGRWRRGAAPPAPGPSARRCAVAARRRARRGAARSGAAPSRSNVARAACSSSSAASSSPSARQRVGEGDACSGDLVGHPECPPPGDRSAERGERQRRHLRRRGGPRRAAPSTMAAAPERRPRRRTSPARRGRAGPRRRRRRRGGPRPPPRAPPVGPGGRRPRRACAGWRSPAASTSPSARRSRATPGAGSRPSVGGVAVRRRPPRRTRRGAGAARPAGSGRRPSAGCGGSASRSPARCASDDRAGPVAVGLEHLRAVHQALPAVGHEVRLRRAPGVQRARSTRRRGGGRRRTTHASITAQ